MCWLKFFQVCQGGWWKRSLKEPWLHLRVKMRQRNQSPPTWIRYKTWDLEQLCNGLNEKRLPWAPVFEHMVSSWWCYLSRFRGVACWKETMEGKRGFVGIELHLTSSLLSLLPVYIWRYAHSFQLLPSCLPFATTSSVMMESYPYGTMSPIQPSFCKIPWSLCFITTTEKVTNKDCKESQTTNF